MLILLILVSALLGFFLGCKFTGWTITWMIERGTISLFYDGQLAEEFRWW